MASSVTRRTAGRTAGRTSGRTGGPRAAVAAKRAAALDVTLAPLRLSYAPALVRWLRDPAVAATLGLRSTPTLAKTRAFIVATAEATADADTGADTGATAGATSCPRAILLGGRHVGNVVLDQIDRRIGKARLHIYVGDPAARGHGVGQRAVALALAHAFGPLRLHKVWLTVHVRNAAAIRAYAAVGFAVEGVHRGEFLLGDERLDELYMGALAPAHVPAH